MAAKKATWQSVLTLIATGNSITGEQLLGLRGLDVSEQIDPKQEYEVGEESLLAEVIVCGAKLAKEATGDTTIDWLEHAVNFHIEVDIALATGQEPTTTLRCFAWELGMQADFAAGLRAVEAG